MAALVVLGFLLAGGVAMALDIKDNTFALFWNLGLALSLFALWV